MKLSCKNIRMFVSGWRWSVCNETPSKYARLSNGQFDALNCCMQVAIQQNADLRKLKSMSDEQVVELLTQCGADSEDRRCLVTALQKLRIYSGKASSLYYNRV